MLPQAIRLPALPVFNDSISFLLNFLPLCKANKPGIPSSSESLWITILLPTIEFLPGYSYIKKFCYI